MGCRTKNRIKWTLIFHTCIRFVIASREEVIHDKASALCPYTTFCKRNSTKHLGMSDSKPCCTNCSCDTICAKTNTCCPDKHGLLEGAIQNTTCKTPFIKSNDLDIYGYQVIDYCPTTEDNVTLTTMCIGEVKENFQDYIWVEDTKTKIIYQNRYCADCHHVTAYSEWKLTTTCKNILMTSFDNIQSLLFSEKCELILQPPEKRDRCFVLDYTKCNQTGLWINYDADVDWACNVYHSPYFADYQIGKRRYEVFKNPFCYVCNKKRIRKPATLCELDPLSGKSPGISLFTAVIDYRLFDGLVLSPMCNSNEIRDTITGLCRTLFCPFGTAAKKGECVRLLESTSHLVVDIKFALTVVGSRQMYKIDDELQKLITLGAGITAMLQGEAAFSDATVFCPFCKIYLEMTNNISVNAVETEDKDTFSNDSFKTNNSVHFKFNVQIITSSVCHIQNIFEMASKIIGSTFYLQINDTTEMKLKVGLWNAQLPIAPILILNEYLDVCNQSNSETKGYYYYYLRDEMICPKIRIKYSEFSSFRFVADRRVIDSFFTKNEAEHDSYVDICIDQYFLKFAALSQGYMSAEVVCWVWVSSVSLSFVIVDNMWIL